MDASQARIAQLEQQLWRVTNPPKKLNVAYILLIFFGSLGVHRFYLGKIGTGILWLLTLGLVGIGTLVDIFRLRTMTQDENMKAWNRENENYAQNYAYPANPPQY